MTALLTLSHGSRHPQAPADTEALTREAARRAEASNYRAAHLEFNTPDLTTAARELAEAGEREAIVVPLLFTQGFHHRHDVPRALDDAAATSGLNLHLAEGLGTGWDMARTLARRARPARQYVVYSVGSADDNANLAVAELANKVEELTGVPTQEAFATRGGAEMIRGEDALDLDVLPLFVAHGLLLDKLPAAYQRPLGTALAEVVADRYLTGVDGIAYHREKVGL